MPHFPCRCRYSAGLLRNPHATAGDGDSAVVAFLFANRVFNFRGADEKLHVDVKKCDRRVRENVRERLHRDFALKRNQQIIHPDIETEVLAFIQIEDSRAADEKPLKRLIGSEKLQNLRRSVVLGKIDENLIDAESKFPAVVQRNRRFHANEFALCQIVRRVESSAAPGCQTKLGRFGQYVALFVNQHDFGKYKLHIRAGELRIGRRTDFEICADLARCPGVCGKMEHQCRQHQLQAKSHTGILSRYARRLFDRTEFIEQTVKLRQRRHDGIGRGVDERRAVSRNRQSKIDEHVIPAKHTAARILMLAPRRCFPFATK